MESKKNDKLIYNGKYYLGLDIGTDSVGYAVTDTEYNLLKFNGEPAWGVTVFPEGETKEKRRSFRTARRRLDRRQQRVMLLQEIFAKEISKKDKRFFIRQQESNLFRDEVSDQCTLFNDPEYTDKEYYTKYPTIHHLITDLMNDDKPHDVRLVYLGCAWLVAHRGHFLSKIDVKNLESIRDFAEVYNAFMNYFAEKQDDCINMYPWQVNETQITAFGTVLKQKATVTEKKAKLIQILYNGNKPKKKNEDNFPYGRDAIVTFLAGGTCNLKDLFCNEEYSDYGSIKADSDDSRFMEVMELVEDDEFELIKNLRELTDWGLLANIMGDGDSICISEARVAIYDQHKQDLAFLKYIIRTYLPGQYNDVFRNINPENYVAYSYHYCDAKKTAKIRKPDKKASIETFSSYLLKHLKNINVADKDLEKYQDMMSRLATNSFMPKQKNTDNRVIPYQLYEYELLRILENASSYLPFLTEQDADGLTAIDKIHAIFTFRIPYFVGPLNTNSQYAWLKRKEGKIYPWNFESMVDLDASEENFIERLTNTCTYLPGEPVLPKDSLLYQKFAVLNILNPIAINGERISAELKQDIYANVCLKRKSITKKGIIAYLISHNIIRKDEEDLVSGIDDKIEATLSSHIAFGNLLNSGKLAENDVERIIARSSYAEDKSRLLKWLRKEYPQLTDKDRRYISRIRISGFGRLSKHFLADLEGVNEYTGEVVCIIGELWNTTKTLQELLTFPYSFKKECEKYCKDYYASNPISLENRMQDMYLPNNVKRSVYRTLAIVKDIEKAFGKPAKIFVEVTRGGDPNQKGKRTKSRKEQILELYKACTDTELAVLANEKKKELDNLGAEANTKLQKDKFFLYYIQLGKCMYTGKSITPLELQNNDMTNIDHIIPQKLKKDDSLFNNKVLVMSEENGRKGDEYPLSPKLRRDMIKMWELYHKYGLINDEKYRRLIRSAALSEQEKWDFINRQIVSTSQSAKAVASLLQEKYPESKLVYCKARVVTDFRQNFKLVKCRTYNDLHHAIDAYLNIVTGNVYNMKFSAGFDVNTNYSVNIESMFTHDQKRGGIEYWNAGTMLEKVKNTARKNTAHFTDYAFFKGGKLFDINPVSAADDLTPLKHGSDPKKYGGYSGAAIMFYVLTKYTIGNKTDAMLMPVELAYGQKFMHDKNFAYQYTTDRLQKLLGKPVSNISYPLGNRVIKIHTMFSLDGYKVSLTGSGGKNRVRMQPITQFASEPKWNDYLKRIENLVRKMKERKDYVFSELYDKLTKEENLQLYDLYINKYKNTIMKNRITSPVDVLQKQRGVFENLSIENQAIVLLSIHSTFCRNSVGGVDLSLILGKANAVKSICSTKLSVLKGRYNDIRIIDSSVSGLWSKTSDNLLEMI